MTDGQQLYEVVVQATGEVRDKDGNVVSNPTFEGTQVMTAEEIQALTEDVNGGGSE